jgi:hypothetical protein
LAAQGIGDDPGQPDPAAIFKAQGNIARYVVIGNGGLDTIMPGRFGNTGGTTRSGFPLKWQRQIAGKTGWPYQKMQLLPAIGAKGVRIVHDLAARRATRRQSEINNRAQRRRQIFHIRLVEQQPNRHKPENVTANSPPCHF